MTTRHRSGLAAAGLAAAALLAGGPAPAQTAPDAGSLQRQFKQEGIPSAPGVVPAAPATPASSPDPGPRLAVQRFVVEGATLIPARELEAVLDAEVGRSLTMGELQHAAQRVADHYRGRGYFARAYLPPQDVTEGTVVIRVVEGRFGSIRLQPGATRANADFVARMVGRGLAAGQPYSADALERGLLLANDLPGIQADGTLTAGETTGASDLGLVVQDTAFVSGSVGVNNWGTRSTGYVQGTAAVALNNLSGIGDQFSLSAAGAGHLGYGMLGYSLPLGTSGLRGGVSASYLEYRLGREFDDLDARGKAITYGAYLSYPLRRTSAENMWLRLAYDHGRYDDDALGEALHRKRTNAGRLSLAGDWSDGVGGGGLTRYLVEFSAGSLDLSRVEADDQQDEAGPKAQDGFAKLALDLNRDQALGTDWFLRARLAGQWTGNNLNSSEQFALGGPNGVRAYPINEGLGDSGALASLEIHRPLRGGWAAGMDLFGFVDAGVVRQHADPWSGWNAGSETPNTYGLFGAGLGFAYALPHDWQLTAVAAVPIGANRGSASDDHNQDGSHKGPRLWASLVKYF